MKLVIDARTIYRPNRRGTGKNLIDLYRHLAAMRPEWRFVMFHQRNGVDDPFVGLENVEHRRIDIKGDRFDLWQQVRLPLAAALSDAHVMHCPANTAPRWAIVPVVVTIHDLIALEGGFSTLVWRRWAGRIAAAARKARRILTPSEHTKRQIIKRFGIAADRITVNYWAPDRNCRKVTDAEQLNHVAAKYGLQPSRPYVLAFGAADPRKNTQRLIQAWAKAPPVVRRNYVLLVVGIEGPALARFKQQARDLAVNDSCLLHGFALEEDLAALISGAEVLCYVSLSEGFGLPILDAFACETAVLTSNTTSMPEVAGDAALLVDPYDVDCIAASLTELLTQPALRAELVGRGRRRVEGFTWQACARRVCRVFEQVV